MTKESQLENILVRKVELELEKLSEYLRKKRKRMKTSDDILECEGYALGILIKGTSRFLTKLGLDPEYISSIEESQKISEDK